jgi:hypothetical protein
MSLLRSEIERQDRGVDETLQGYTALHYAILYGHVEAVALLLESGADPNLEDLHGTKPLEHCALTDALDGLAALEVTQLLLRSGAHAIETAKTYAEERGKSGMASLVRKHARDRFPVDGD